MMWYSAKLDENLEKFTKYANEFFLLIGTPCSNNLSHSA